MAERVVSYKVDEATGDVEFRVKSGGPNGSDAAITLQWAMVSEANKERFSRYGRVQRSVDAAALSKDTATGKSRTPQEKFAQLSRVVGHYNTGSEAWSPSREGGGLVLDGLLLQAIAEVKGLDVEGARALVLRQAEKKGMNPREFLALAATGDLVAPVVARMRAERAGLNADELLDEEESEGGED